MTEQLGQLQNAAIQYQIKALENAANANAESGNDYMTSLQNILKISSSMGMDLDTKQIEQYATAMQNMDDTQKAEFIAGFDPQTQLVLAGLAASTAPQDAPEVKNI